MIQKCKFDKCWEIIFILNMLNIFYFYICDFSYAFITQFFFARGFEHAYLIAQNFFTETNGPANVYCVRHTNKRLRRGTWCVHTSPWLRWESQGRLANFSSSFVDTSCLNNSSSLKRNHATLLRVAYFMEKLYAYICVNMADWWRFTPESLPK